MLTVILCLVIIYLIILLVIDEKEIKKLKNRQDIHLKAIDKLTRRLISRSRGSR